MSMSQKDNDGLDKPTHTVTQEEEAIQTALWHEELGRKQGGEPWHEKCDWIERHLERFTCEMMQQSLAANTDPIPEE